MLDVDFSFSYLCMRKQKANSMKELKIIILEIGYHGFRSLLPLLEDEKITTVQFLLHSEADINDDYINYCKGRKVSPYEESIALDYASMKFQFWKEKYNA